MRARYSARVALLLSAGALASSCGAASHEPSVGAQRAVAGQFAAAIFRGRTAAAIGLLEQPRDPGLIWLTKRAARRWKSGHAAIIHLPGRRAGRTWVFGYAGTHTRRDGSFEQVRGDIVVAVAASPGRAGVESFALPHPTIRFGTHHDSVLLPSNR